MPSETYHLRNEHHAYLDGLVEDNETLENRSQALKYLINQAQQREMLQ